MLQDLLGSAASTAAYRRFAAEKGSRTFFYLLFLSFLFTLAGSVALKLRVAPAIDETFLWLEQSTPKLTFSGGKVSSELAEPVRLTHPRLPEIALMIDTSRTTPVTLADMRDVKVQAFLSGNAMYIDRQTGALETFDLSKAGLDKPTTVDPEFFREASRAFKIIVYPAAVMAVFAFFAAVTAVVGLVNAVLGLIFNSLMGGQLGFGALYKIGIHSQTASTLLRILLAFMPFGVPLVGFLLAIVTAVYTYLGVRESIEPPAALAHPPA